MILHLARQADWDAAQAGGLYRPASLAEEGFIHFSTPEQVGPSAERYYKGASDLVLLTVDEGLVTGDLRWEESGHGVFPHLYDPLAVGEVIDASPYPAP